MYDLNLMNTVLRVGPRALLSQDYDYHIIIARVREQICRSTTVKLLRRVRTALSKPTAQTAQSNI